MVYFIQIQDNGPIKIGSAKHPPSRMSMLQIGIPEKLNLVMVLFGDNELERILHRKFNNHRIRGEWFRPHEDILSFIKSGEDKDGPIFGKTRWTKYSKYPYERTACSVCRLRSRCPKSNKDRHGFSYKPPLSADFFQKDFLSKPSAMA
jgi:hypothetical protein